MIVVGDDEHEKQNLKEKLVAQLKIKDLGKLLHWIEVTYSKKGILISQIKYVLDLLKVTQVKIKCKNIGVPIEQNHIIGSDEGSPTVNTGQSQTCGEAHLLSPN